MAILLFITLGVTLSLHMYLQYRHKLPSYKYEQHIQLKLEAMRIDMQQLDYLYNNRDRLLYARSYRKAMRFNNKW